MAEAEKELGIQNGTIEQLREAAEIGLRVAEPHERINEKLIEEKKQMSKSYGQIIKWLIIGWVVSVAVLGGVLAFHIYKAYEEPVTYEQAQEQSFEEETQTQTNNGSAN